MRKDNLKVTIGNLEEAIERTGTIRAGEIDLEPPKAELEIWFRIEKCGSEALVSGSIDSSFQTECAFCLGAAQVSVSEEFRLSHRIGSADEIDLVPDVRDAFLTGIPIQVKCSADCKGLCAGCGQNLNKGKCKCSPESGKPTLRCALDEALERGQE